MKLSRLIEKCASLRLTLTLLFGLAAIAIFGTVWPSRDTEMEVLRYELFYQSIGFRLLLCLLALNLIACTIRLLQRRMREGRLWEKRLLGTEGGASLGDLPNEVELKSGLVGCGFAVQQVKDGLLGRRMPWARWSVLLVHASVLLIMAGALLSGLGFVGTLNIYSGESSDVYFDWDRKQDLPAGFTFRLDHFEPQFYPIELRFAAINPTDGAELADYTVIEGDTVDLPRGDLQAKVQRFDPISQRLELQILRLGEPVQDYIAQAGVKDPENTVAGLVLYPLAFRNPLLKQYYSEVSILERDEVVARGVIQVNKPLIWRGVAIYQTAFDADKEGRLYAGFQFSRDPGEPLVWIGSVLLLLGLIVNLFCRCRVIGLRQIDGLWELLPLSGFQGEAGRERFEALVQQLTAMTHH